MASFIKPTHNLTAYLTKSKDYPQYDDMINTLINSQYHTALTIDPPIYADALKQFWDNAIVLVHDQQPISILSKVNDKSINLTPDLLNRALHLNDDDGATTFTSGMLHTTFVECDYQGQLDHATLFKRYFGPAHKFLFHTILQCLSPKTTSWDQMPFGPQKIFHSVVQKQNFKASAYFFTELVLNAKSSNKFCLYPRFVMQCLIEELGNASHIGGISKIKSLTSQIFARLNTQALLLTTQDAQGNQPTPEEPTSTTSTKKQKKQKATSSLPTKPTKKPKKVIQEDEVPDRPVASPKQQTQATAETSSLQVAPPPPKPAPQLFSSQKVVVSPRETTSEAEISLDTHTSIPSPRDTLPSPPSQPLSPIALTLLSLDNSSGQLTSSPITTSLEMPLHTSDQLEPMLTQGDEDEIRVTSPVSNFNQTADAAISQTDSIELFDDFSYIFKTSAVATTDDVVLYTTEVRSPQYHEQGAHDNTVQDTGHDVSGLTRDSGDSINLDDESKILIKELTAKFSSLESEVSNLKEMVTKMATEQAHHLHIPHMMASSLEDSHPTTSTTPNPPAISASNPDQSQLLSNLNTLLKQHQQIIQNTLSQQHKLQTYYLHNYVDKSLLELQRLIKETHNHITKATGITPPTPWFPSAEDEAKKGEKVLDKAQKAHAAAVASTEQQKKKVLNKLAKNVAANREREEYLLTQGSSSSGQPRTLPPLPSFPELIAQAIAAGHIPADFITTAEVSADVQTIIAQTTAEPLPQTQIAKSAVVITTDTQTTDSLSLPVVETSTPAVVQTTTPAVDSSVVTSPTAIQTTTDEVKTKTQVKFQRKRKLVVSDEEEESQSTILSPPHTSQQVQSPITQTTPINTSISKPSEKNLVDLTDEEIAALNRKAIEESAMDYMLEQGYEGEMLQMKYNEEVDRLIKEAEAAEESLANPKKKSKSKAKSTIPEEERKRMVEELIINDFGSRNSVTRWQDKRLREEYRQFLDWKKRFPHKYKPYNPQALTVKSTRTTTSKSKPTPSANQTKTYTVMIPSISQDPLLPHTKALSIHQQNTKWFDIHANLEEDEKILITEQYDPKDVGVLETSHTKGSSRPQRKIMKLPVMTKPSKSSVSIKELSPSPTSTQQKAPTQQSKQIIPSMSQRPANIVKWSVDKKTHWMMITKEDGLTTIYKDWYDLLGLSEHDHKVLMNMNIEGEEDVPRAKEFELELKGQIWQRYYSKK